MKKSTLLSEPTPALLPAESPISDKDAELIKKMNDVVAKEDFEKKKKMLAAVIEKSEKDSQRVSRKCTFGRGGEP